MAPASSGLRFAMVSTRLCPEILQLQRLLQAGTVIDGCAYGLKGASGEYTRKPWRLLSSCPSQVNVVNRRCPGHLRHQKVEQGDTKKTEKYTPQLAKALVRGLLSKPGVGSREPEALLNDPAESPFMPALLAAIKTSHSNLGHQVSNLRRRVP